MTVIVLEKVYDEQGIYKGRYVIYEADLTSELLEYIKIAPEWKKWRPGLKEKGYIE